MEDDFERPDFFDDLLSDDGSFDAKMGLQSSPDSGHGSPQSFTSSGSSSAVGHFFVSCSHSLLPIKFL